MVTLAPTARQIPLIHIVESDDLFLADQPDVLWFDVLRSLDYHQFQATAARYYERLYTFNLQQKEQRIERRENPPAPNPETQGQAAVRGTCHGRQTIASPLSAARAGNSADPRLAS
jgi:hypothetical protein